MSPLPPAAGARVLRVGIDARSLQPGFREHSARGVGVYARELLRVLAARQDLALTLWFEPALPVLNGLVPPGVLTRRYARTPLPLRDRIASQLAVAAAAHGRHHDVFHWLSHMHAPALPPRRSVLTVHDLVLERFASLHPDHATLAYRAAREMEGMAMRKATVLIADSNATRDELLASHANDPTRVRVAPLGVSPRFAPASAAEITAVRKHHGLNVPFVLYLGGIDARKDVPLLLDAFARAVARRDSPVMLVLAGHVLGAPEYPALMERARALKLTERMRVLEFVPLEHLAMLLSAARVFAFPSRSEGFGLPPLEAMACGTPVVCTTGGALGEVVGDAGLTAPPGDAVTFAAQLERALDDEPLRETLRARGLARAGTFTWARTAEATVAAYRVAIGAGAAV